MRRLFIRLHLMIAAFFAPILLMVALSGGLYLLGQKGQTLKTPIPLSDDLAVAIAATPTEGGVKALLADIDPQYDFDYLKISGSTLITRPTSRSYYEVNLQNSAMLTRIEPDWIKSMIELHKGHGPSFFKGFPKSHGARLVAYRAVRFVAWLDFVGP